MSYKPETSEKGHQSEFDAENEVEDTLHAQEASMLEDEATPNLEGQASPDQENADDPLKEQEQKFMRLSADFANYKRRTEKEKLEIYKSANERLIQALLPVIDNMERALGHAQESSKEAFVNGVEMVFKNMMDVMQKEGLQAIDALDQPFDHNLHHAVMTEPKEGYDSDFVIGVLQKGYQLGDKVIRPAMVKVSE